jgi:hypothetical protein
MRVAALYDIHGNLPALQAVLPQVEQAGVDLVVVGDVLPGPMPRETVARLLDLDIRTQFILGNEKSPFSKRWQARNPPAFLPDIGLRFDGRRSSLIAHTSRYSLLGRRRCALKFQDWGTRCFATRAAKRE